jgi:F420-non-reducing hydrogenase large subunit
VGVGQQVIQARKWGHEAAAIFGGRPVNPENAIPGGVSKPITAQERDRLEEIARYLLEFAKFTLVVLHEQVLANPRYLDLVLHGPYSLQTYSMGLVDDKNRANFYDGKVRVLAPDGKELSKYAGRDYTKHVAERVEPWTYLTFPFLTEVGWKGFTDGKQSGVYRATPQARLNVADAMSTPLAQEAYEEYFDTLTGDRSGKTMVHYTLAIHWARVVEMVNAAERALDLVRHPELTHPENYRVIPHDTPTEGVGVVEAPRGTLVHHYVTDENGIVRKANLVVGTTNNHAAICMSIKKAAQGLIRRGREVNEGVLNMIEMAFRAYDPCFGCATHSLAGRRPWSVTVRNPDGTVAATYE